MESYYDPIYCYDEFVKDLEWEKIVSDKLSLVLLAKFLKHNIMVISPFNTWTMYPTYKTDIILTYDGRFGATQDLSTSVATQSKSDMLLKLFLNLDSNEKDIPE